MKFLALTEDFSNFKLRPFGFKEGAQTGVKDGYPLKVVILLLLARVA